MSPKERREPGRLPRHRAGIVHEEVTEVQRGDPNCLDISRSEPRLSGSSTVHLATQQKSTKPPRIDWLDGVKSRKSSVRHPRLEGAQCPGGLARIPLVTPCAFWRPSIIHWRVLTHPNRFEGCLQTSSTDHHTCGRVMHCHTKYFWKAAAQGRTNREAAGKLIKRIPIREMSIAGTTRSSFSLVSGSDCQLTGTSTILYPSC